MRSCFRSLKLYLPRRTLWWKLRTTEYCKQANFDNWHWFGVALSCVLVEESNDGLVENYEDDEEHEYQCVSKRYNRSKRYKTHFTSSLQKAALHLTFNHLSDESTWLGPWFFHLPTMLGLDPGEPLTGSAKTWLGDQIIEKRTTADSLSRVNCLSTTALNGSLHQVKLPPRARKDRKKPPLVDEIWVAEMSCSS